MKRKITSIILCLLLVVSMISPMSVDAASTLSLKKKSLYIGQTFTLQVKGASSKAKITFSSSKPGVATVSKSTGKVKALKAGVTTVKATIKTTSGKKTTTKTLKCAVTVRKCTHVWYAETTVQPTCKNMGEKIYTCSVCKMKKVSSLPMTEHKYKLKTILELPTCKEAGKGRYECITCGHIEEGIIEKLDTHTWNNGKVTKSPTCSSEGVKTYTCTICGATKTETIDINKNAHVWDDGVVTQEATCTQWGTTKHVCEECGDTKIEYTPCLGHDYTTKVVQATLTSQGYTTYTCNTCKHTYNGDYKWYVPSESYASSTTGVKTQNALKPGSTWTTSAVYMWNGGEGSNFAKTASGTSAFAYACSDAMFGIDPAYYVSGHSGIRAGDIIYTATDCYFVEAVTLDTVYAAHSNGSVAVWDVAVPLSDVTHYLSRWYQY